MADIIKMLALSPTMEEGTLIEWFKKEGDTIEEGELIAEIETDKAAMEMESFFEGTILKLLVKKGDAVPVGTKMAIVGDPDEDISDLLEGDADTDDEEEDTEEEEETESSVAEDDEEEDQDDADDDDDEVEEEEEDDDEVEEEEEDDDEVEEEEEAQDDDDEDDKDTKNKKKSKSKKSSSKKSKSSKSKKSTETVDADRIFASPLARKIAKEKNIDLSSVKGSGPKGRIIKADVQDLEAKDASSKKQKSKKTGDKKQPQASQSSQQEKGQSESLSQVRKTIAKRLGQAWAETPHFFLTRSVDMAKAMQLRKQINQQLQEAETGDKISVNDFIVKACGKALIDYPAMNRSYRGDHYVAYDTADISIAVAIDDGLITPVVRNVESLSLTGISRVVKSLAERARNKKLAPEEYTGGNFAISNLGMYKIDAFTAIINPPESGILACGAVQKVPVVNENNEIVVGTQMKVTLSCDHRIIDGATGAEFLDTVIKYLENPMLLLA